MSEDLIRRSDAIDALRKLGHEVVVIDKVCSLGVAHEFIDAIRDIPSADKPTVIRVKSIMKKEDYESLVDSIRQQNQNAIVIPHNAELVTPVDRPQGEWIDMWDKYCFEGTFKCSVCGTPWTLIDGTPQDNGMNFCPNCGCAMKGADDDQ